MALRTFAGFGGLGLGLFGSALVTTYPVFGIPMMVAGGVLMALRVRGWYNERKAVGKKFPVPDPPTLIYAGLIIGNIEPHADCWRLLVGKIHGLSRSALCSRKDIA